MATPWVDFDDLVRVRNLPEFSTDFGNNRVCNWAAITDIMFRDGEFFFRIFLVSQDALGG